MRTTILGLVAVWALGACGGDDGGDLSRFTITARLGTDLGGAAVGRAAAGDGVADHVLAVPLLGHAPTLSGNQVFEIAADGSITMDLDRGNDWVLMLFDSTAAKEDQFVGFVTLGAGDETMMAFPVGAADPSVDGIDLGTLRGEGAEAVASTTLEDTAGAFTLSLDELVAIAHADGAFRAIVNDYLNTGDVYYQARPVFGFTTHGGEVGAAPEDYAYDLYAVDASSDDVAHLDVTALCAGTSELTFVPPVAFTTSLGASFGPDAPLSTAGSTPDGEGCLGPDINLDAPQASGPQVVGLGLLAGGEVGRIPLPATLPGWWYLQVDGVEVALFDLAIADPVVDDHPTGPVPGFAVATDANGVITSFSVTYATWDATTGAYLPVTDRAGVERLISSAWLNIRGQDGGSELQYAPVGTLLDATVTPGQAWSVGAGAPPAGAERVDYVSLGVTTGSVSFNFEWWRF